MEQAWIALPAGLLISTVASAVGIGGGVLWMPFLLIVLKIRADTAVLTSLMIQTAGMGSGSVAYYAQRRIDGRLALLYLAVAAPGLFAGAVLLGRAGSSQMELLLGVMVMATAFLFVSSNQKYHDIGENRADIPAAIRHSWVTVMASVITGMLSVSMSEWLIPLMRARLSVKMSRAIATCVFIAFGACVISVAIHVSLGRSVRMDVVLWGVPGVIIGGQIGPRMTRVINDRILKEVFIFLLTLVGIHLIFNAY